MSENSIQLHIAADNQFTEELQSTLSPTLYDGLCALPDKLDASNDQVVWSSFDDLTPYVEDNKPLSCTSIILDLRGFTDMLSPLIIYLSPVLYRWTGEKLTVILPSENYASSIAAICDLLRSLELRSKGIRIISCPTCARCRTNFPAMVRSIEKKLSTINKPLDVAIMGCEVNGPGEAKAADIGIAFGDQKGMLFKNGEKIRVVSIDEAADVLLQELENI